MGRLTFGLRVIVAFLAVDALLHAAALGALLGREPLERGAFVDRYLPELVLLAFDVLLASQIALRAKAGRFWGVIFLGTLALLSLFLLVLEPARWTALTPGGRVRLLLGLFASVAFVMILLGRRAGKVLVR